ncbi:MAG: hypothetical protein M3N68_07065 [Actinomycetota bacterium]|nr:hypothetical protein [Actinomycetota bacterium]
MAADARAPVTRADIEAKLRQIRGEVETTAAAAKPYATAAAVAVVVVVIGLTYALGRRKGKKRTTLVEIRQL